MRRLVALTLLIVAILFAAICGFLLTDTDSEETQPQLSQTDSQPTESQLETADSQSARLSLPSDLFFSTGTEADEYRFFRAIAQIDAETLESTHFYIDETIRATNMKGLGWSPTGEYYALFKLANGEICLLTPNGNLAHCFETDDTWLSREMSAYYQFTWSEDGQKAYFVVDLDAMRSLIETDVASGQMLRIIYQYDTQGRVPPAIYWTPSLEYVALYGKEQELGFGYRAEVYGRDVTTIQLATDTLVKMPTEISGLGVLAFCDQFSPLGSYLVARAYTNPDQPGLVLFAPQGNVTVSLPYNRMQEFDLTWTYCPSWQADEQAFFFLAGNLDNQNLAEAKTDATFIFKYSLPDDTLTQLAQIIPPQAKHEIEVGWHPISPLSVSPQGTHIAIQFRDPVYHNIHAIGVLFPTGELIRVNGKFTHAVDPLWKP